MGIRKFGLFLALLASSCAQDDTEYRQEPITPAETISEWQALQLAIIMTESRFNPRAEGKTQDRGLYQITPIYVAEANRLSGRNFSHDDAFSMEKSIEMFDIVQSHYNPEQSIDLAIMKHNPGGAAIGYSRRVKENLKFIKQYEAVRTALKDYEFRKCNEENPRGERSLSPGTGR